MSKVGIAFIGLILSIHLKAYCLKKLVSIAFIVIVLFQSMDKLWIIVSFEVHKTYIVQALCINQDKPQLACAGKCHLTQLLDNAHKQAQKQLPTADHERLESLYAHQLIELCFYPKIKYTRKRPVVQQLLTCRGYFSNVFHPPPHSLYGIKVTPSLFFGPFFRSNICHKF